jgi:signal transduction protein with GAF and PtsI domain
LTEITQCVILTLPWNKNQELNPRRRPKAMKTIVETQEVFEQFSGKAVEALALWADATQKIVRELADLSASTVKESVQLSAKLQSSALDAVKDGQGYWLRRQRDLTEWQKDPFGWYQKSLLEGIQETQKSFKLLEGNAQTMARTAEQLQATAEKAAREIQQTFSTLAADVKTVYTHSEN